MGTRSLTLIEEDGRVIVNMYRQFDGYPTGHGADLAEFLASGTVVNGYSDKGAKQFNGMGCLAAQMVANFKKCVGDFYMYHPDERDLGEEYTYRVSFIEGELRVEISGYEGIEFEGNVEEFTEYCSREKEESE